MAILSALSVNRRPNGVSSQPKASMPQACSTASAATA